MAGAPAVGEGRGAAGRAARAPPSTLADVITIGVTGTFSLVPFVVVCTAAILLAQLAAWLGISFAGFGLLLWPFAARGVASAFTDAGSSMFTLGFAEPGGAAPSAIVFVAAATGLVIVTLQIAYLPTLYSAFNRTYS